jgi:hypothetical protein
MQFMDSGREYVPRFRLPEKNTKNSPINSIAQVYFHMKRDWKIAYTTAHQRSIFKIKIYIGSGLDLQQFIIVKLFQFCLVNQSL